MSSLFFQVISAALSKIRLEGQQGRGYQELDLDADWLLEMMATVKQQTLPIFYLRLVSGLGQ